jgi:hypothetical protein
MEEYRREAVRVEGSEAEMAKWHALVAAEQEVARCRAEINESPSRTELLIQAILDGSVWDRSTAMTFLRLFPDDVPTLLGILVDSSLSLAWAEPVREVIRAARDEIDPTKLAKVVASQLRGGNAEDYLRIADMLASLEAWESLSEVVRMARASVNPEIREVARCFTESHGDRLPG